MDINNSTVALALFGASSSSTGTDTSLLTNYFNAKAGITTSASSSSSSSSTSSTTSASTKSNSPTGTDTGPTAPWNASDATQQDSDLLNAVMQGQAFVKPSRVTSDALNADPDYTKLFALYQGLDALEQIATAAQAKNVSPNQLAAYQRRFAQGLSEVQGYVSDTDYTHVQLTSGVLTDDLQNTVGTARTNSTYVAQDISSGSLNSAVSAFSGDVQFTISAQKVGTKDPITVNINLADMGTTTRSMPNVVSYINSQLKAAGLSTRFAVNSTTTNAVTSTVNGVTMTLAQPTTTYGLQINGVSYESLTLSAPSTADSVYVTQTTGDPTKTPASTSASSTSSTDATSSTSSSRTASTDVTSRMPAVAASANAASSPLTLATAISFVCARCRRTSATVQPAQREGRSRSASSRPATYPSSSACWSRSAPTISSTTQVWWTAASRVRRSPATEGGASATAERVGFEPTDGLTPSPP